jgi:hypothetical protein
MQKPPKTSISYSPPSMNVRSQRPKPEFCQFHVPEMANNAHLLQLPLRRLYRTPELREVTVKHIPHLEQIEAI